MSFALNGSSVIRHVKHSDAIATHKEIAFDFYTGLSHIFYVLSTGHVLI